MIVSQVSMKAFIIIRDDGMYIEQRREKGATHYEPGDVLPPRLWFNKHKAKSWLTVYCRGAWRRHYYNDDGSHIDKVKPVPGRTADRFTIKEVLIHDL